MLYRIQTLLVKELIQIFRVPVLVFMIIFGPLTEMSLIAWTTAAPIDNLPTAVVNLDGGPAGRDLLAALKNTETFDFQHFFDNTAAATALLERGKVIAVLSIPAGYSAQVASPLGQTPAIGFILDGADPTAARTALNSVEGAAAAQGQRIVSRWIGREDGAVSLIQPRLRVRFNEELKKSIYTVPSELGLILFAIGLIISSISIARERELGTLEQLMVTPAGRFELVTAKAIPAVILSYVSFSLMMAVAITFFDVPMRGSWLLLYGASSIFLFVEISIGLMISAVSGNQVQAMMGGMLWVMTEFFFSGYGVPVENMPLILQTLAHIFPIYHFMIIFRAILLKGVGLSVIWPQILAGIAIGVVVIPTAIWFLGRQKWE